MIGWSFASNNNGTIDGFNNGAMESQPVLGSIKIKKLFKIIIALIIFTIAALYLLDGLEYTEAEREWCKEHRPLLPIEICAKKFGY